MRGLLHTPRPAAALALVAGLLGIALLAGCASDPTRTPLGLTREQALQRLGPPSATYPLAGGERLQYSRAPMGFEVTNVDLDASGHVASVVQEMDEKLFSNTIKIDQWRQDDVLRTYGRPYEIARVTSFNGTVWSWRYLQINNRRFLYIYIDPQGVVRRYHVGDEVFNDPLPRW